MMDTGVGGGGGMIMDASVGGGERGDDGCCV